MRVVSQREFARIARREARKELAKYDFDGTQRALVLLGAVPRGFDLRNAIVDDIATNTAGVYDDDKKEILVVHLAGGKVLDELDLGIVAHELEHAIADSALGLPDADDTDWGDEDSAVHAVVEGTATRTEFAFSYALEGSDVFEDLLEAELDDLFYAGKLPYYLDQAALFPYVEGIGFVCELYARGGWPAVNRAFRVRPRSTAEILFPERYIRGELPEEPTDLGSLHPPWRKRAVSGRFGAADLLYLFGAPGADEDRALDGPLRRAAAWGGGAITVWTKGPQTAVGISLVQHARASGLCASMRLWSSRAVPRGNAVRLYCKDREIRLAIAPSPRIAETLARMESP